MEDEANVDQRRRAAGLGTLANYACVIRAMYGTPAPEPGVAAEQTQATSLDREVATSLE
jgi:hypothetical protein